jgi:inosine/xanthosine triphosphate pyrophosphatase family protein
MQDSEFYLDLDEPVDPEEMKRHEAEFWERMKDCRVSSGRLERAKRSEKAKAFFSREPNEEDGFDRLWVAAIDSACFKSLIGIHRDYGVEFADNFGDFQDGRPEDGLYTIEDMAAYKARKVYEATGLPCIAARTSFEIEPIPPASAASVPGKTAASVGNGNPRVLSGYRINDIGMHPDYICDALRPMSEPDRVTRFTSCLCFYDGEIEIFEYAVCDVDLFFANSVRTFIPMAQAINNMAETLKLTFVSSGSISLASFHHSFRISSSPS